MSQREVVWILIGALLVAGAGVGAALRGCFVCPIKPTDTNPIRHVSAPRRNNRFCLSSLSIRTSKGCISGWLLMDPPGNILGAPSTTCRLTYIVQNAALRA